MKPSSVIHAFKNAVNGIVLTLKNERNFRIHVCVAVAVVWFSVIFGADRTQIATLFIMFGVVMGFELFNTAIEITADMNVKEYNLYIKQIKDICAGGVSIGAVCAVVYAIVLFWDTAGWQRVWNTVLTNPVMDAAAVVYVGLSLWFIIGGKHDK